MRAVILTPEYPPARSLGGIATNTLALAQALAHRGHEVFVVAPMDQATATAASRRGGPTVVGVQPRWVPGRRLRTMWQRRQFAAATARLQPDVVHAAEWQAMAWWLARFSPTPVVTRLATPTYVLEELNSDGSGRAMSNNSLLRFLEADQTRRSAVVYAPTQAIIERVGTDWRLAAIRQIPNAIDVADVATAGEAPPPVPLPNRFIAFIGRLERRKGVDPLARALAVVLADHPDVHAVLVGRDAGDIELMARFRDAVAPVADRVHLLGELARRDALAVVARAAVVALPSLWESFGYVAVEALALGRAVVASRTGGLAEIIEDGVSGWLVPVGDAGALADRLAACLDDPAVTSAIGHGARRRAGAFDIAEVAGQVETLLEASRTRFVDRSLYRGGYRRFFRPEENGDPFSRIYARKRESVVAYFAGTNPTCVLDAGGGFGRLAAPLSARHDVTLVDVSAEMLAEARQRCSPAVDLVQCDARHLPFRDRAFARVLALDLLCHLPDLAAGLRELARVAREEVVFDTTNARPAWVLAYPAYVNWRPARLLRTLRGGGVLPEWQELVRHHDPREVASAAQRAGLRLAPLAAIGPAPLVKWHVWKATRR